MAKKVPAVELDLIHPHKTRKRKFGCEHCDIKYTLKHYRILYDAKKISYFSLREKPKYVVCHQCLYKLAQKFKDKLKVKKIILKLDLVDEEVLIRI
jgi:transposase